jgi:hypothetical protein
MRLKKGARALHLFFLSLNCFLPPFLSLFSLSLSLAASKSFLAFAEPKFPAFSPPTQPQFRQLLAAAAAAASEQSMLITNSKNYFGRRKGGLDTAE